jgi:hypothetical protein
MLDMLDHPQSIRKLIDIEDSKHKQEEQLEAYF